MPIKKSRIKRSALTALAALLCHYAMAAAPWQSSQVYNAGDTVTVAGQDYRAQWWTKNQHPQQYAGPLGSGQPWLVLDPTQPPLACGNAWRAQAAYQGNAVVSRQGHNYVANWWTKGADPAVGGTQPVWRDAGICNYLADYSYTLTAQQVQPISFAGQQLTADYRIRVQLPANFQPDHAYPVVYVLDWFVVGALVTEQYQALQASGQVAPLILVGVDCPDSIDACWLRRERDYTPTYWQAEDEYLGNFDPNLRITGGGPALQAFLQNQLIPQVEGRYITNAAARGIHGTSLSGLWAADALVHHPATFGRYLINSPSLWYHDYKLVGQAQALPASQFAPVQKVFLSMGALEGSPYLEDTAGFASLLAGKQVPVSQAVFPGREHETAPLDATTAGLQATYPAQP